MPANPEAELIERALPSYEIGVELGRGAWGVVLSGRHKRLGRQVAIKQLPQAFAADPGVAGRFLREAQMAASLDHPHIVPVYDYVEEDGLGLIVMEQCSTTVGARFHSDGLHTDEACYAALATCSALAYAHGRGVLHRDIKPENLLVDTDGVVKLGDFGIARAVDEATRLTATGTVIGTPAYMSPEQASGQDMGPTSDVYSIGVVLYELLSGSLPFADASTFGALIRQHLTEPPKPLLDANPDLPTRIAEVVDKALAKDPFERWESAMAFGVALGEATSQAFGAGWTRQRRFALLGASAIIAATEREIGGDPRAGSVRVGGGADEPRPPVQPTTLSGQGPLPSPSLPTVGTTPPPAPAPTGTGAAAPPAAPPPASPPPNPTTAPPATPPASPPAAPPPAMPPPNPTSPPPVVAPSTGSSAPAPTGAESVQGFTAPAPAGEQPGPPTWSPPVDDGPSPPSINPPITPPPGIPGGPPGAGTGGSGGGPNLLLIGAAAAVLVVVGAVAAFSFLGGDGGQGPDPEPPVTSGAAGGDTDTGGGGATPLTGEAALTIGLLIDGGEFSSDEDQQVAIDLAVDDITAAGGVLGRPLAVLPGAYTDDASLITLANQHVAGGATAIVGPTDPVDTTDVLDLVTDAGVVLVSPTDFFGRDGGDGLYFQTRVPNTLVGEAAVSLLDNGIDEVVLLRSDSFLANQDVVNAIEVALELRGADPTIVEVSEQDFEDAAAQVSAIDPGAVMIYGIIDKTGLYTALIDSGVGPQTVPYVAVADDGGALDLPDGAIAGVQGVNADFLTGNALEERVPASDFSASAAQAYDAVIVVALAVEAAGTADSAAIAEWLPLVTGGGSPCTTYAQCRGLLADGTDIDYQGVGGTYDLSATTGRPESGFFQVSTIGNSGFTDSRRQLIFSRPS